MISPTKSMYFNSLVASRATEPGSLLTEPSAMIKFGDFSTYRGTRML